jgi:hypothetical protein
MSSAAAVQGRIDEQRPAPRERPVHTFTFPKKFTAAEVRSVGLVQLTSDEEIMATKRAANNPANMATNLVLQALVEVNGKPVSLTDGSTETAWKKFSPKQRGLLLAAYAELHTPEDSDVEDFLKSQKVQVG